MVTARRKKILVFSLLIILIFFVFLFLLKLEKQEENNQSLDQARINSNWLVRDNRDLKIIYHENSVELHGGIELMAYPITPSELVLIDEIFPDGYFGVMNLITPQDILTVRIGNGAEFPRNFLLKIFYNYLEIDFLILGSGKYKNEFIFSVPAGAKVDIPLQLSETIEKSNMSSKLTIALALAPEQHTMFEDGLSSWHTMVLNFDINYGFYNELILPIELVEPLLLIEELAFFGLMINQDFNPNNEGATRPPNPLYARPGEQVELGFIANSYMFIQGGESLENLLILSMLDWKQIPMNGKPYIRIHVDEDVHQGIHGRFFIEVPNEPGKYEFVAFLIPNATSANTWENFLPQETSMRFTIKVVE